MDSTLGQTLPPHEIIVIDDGSTDDTEERFADADPRVRYVRQSNSGAAAARNRGVREATGEWIAFLDSDDIWTSTHLEHVAAAIDGTDGRAVMYFDDVDWNGSTSWRISGFDITGPYELAPDGSDWLLRASHPCLLPGTVIRRDALVDVGGFKDGMAVREDSHLFFRVGLGAPVCAVAEVGAVATADGAQNRLTRTVPGGSLAYSDRTLELYRDTIAAKPGLARRHRQILRHRLAAAYVTRAGILWADRRPVDSLFWLGRGVALDPASSLRRLVKRTVGGGSAKG